MKKLILIAASATVLVACGAGGTTFMLLDHRSGTTAPAPPKPPQFAVLDDLVVSVPADTGDSTPAYIALTLQFATTNPDAVASFGTLEPIIKAQVITLLMGQTAKQLMDPATHDALTKKCVSIANMALDKDAGFTPPNPFTAVYITSLVEQN